MPLPGCMAGDSPVTWGSWTGLLAQHYGRAEKADIRTIWGGSSI